jgi:hypothetical protein
MPTTTPVTVVTSSKKYSLTAPDWLKALVVAILSPIIPIVYASLQAGSFQLPWKTIGLTAASAALAYLTKNFFTPSQTTISGAPTGSSVSVTTPPPGQSITTIATK